MHSRRMDNGEWMMRANRQTMTPEQIAQQEAHAAQMAAAQAEIMRRYQALPGNLYIPGINPAFNYRPNPVTPGEKPEPEDTTGLRMLDEFLAKRKRER